MDLLTDALIFNMIKASGGGYGLHIVPCNGQHIFVFNYCSNKK
jgi:hypothetical protein